jgi:hypothetical protein
MRQSPPPIYKPSPDEERIALLRERLQPPLDDLMQWCEQQGKLPTSVAACPRSAFACSRRSDSAAAVAVAIISTRRNGRYWRH